MALLKSSLKKSILSFNEDFSKAKLFANKMGILGVDLEKMNLDDDNNFYEVMKSNFWLGIINLKNAKHLKKDRQIINACSLASNKINGEWIGACQKIRKKEWSQLLLGGVENAFSAHR